MIIIFATSLQAPAEENIDETERAPYESKNQQLSLWESNIRYDISHVRMSVRAVVGN